MGTVPWGRSPLLVLIYTKMIQLYNEKGVWVWVWGLTFLPLICSVLRDHTHMRITTHSSHVSAALFATSAATLSKGLLRSFSSHNFSHQILLDVLLFLFPSPLFPLFPLVLPSAEICPHHGIVADAGGDIPGVFGCICTCEHLQNDAQAALDRRQSTCPDQDYWKKAAAYSRWWETETIVAAAALPVL